MRFRVLNQFSRKKRALLSKMFNVTHGNRVPTEMVLMTTIYGARREKRCWELSSGPTLPLGRELKAWVLSIEPAS